MTFGLSPFGFSPFGGGGVADIVLLRAVATSTNSVSIALSAQPLAVDGFDEGDALNPRTWIVKRVDTGERRTILGVRKISVVEFELFVLEDFASHYVTHRVETTTLLSPIGEPLSAATEADFAGVVETFEPMAKPTSRRYGAVDLRNPPFPDGRGVGGTLMVGADGDYESEEGVQFIKKMVIRRLVTPRGGFFHLPDYGVGFQTKEPIPGGDLVRLSAEVERQMKLEPEISDARASITLDRSGVVTIMLRCQLRESGMVVDVGLQASEQRGMVVL